MSQAFLTLTTALREFGREMKREEVTPGMRAATRGGSVSGRLKRIFDRDKVADLRSSGNSIRTIAAKLGVGGMTILADYWKYRQF